MESVSNVDPNAVQQKSRLEMLLENIDTSSQVRKQLEAAQKKLLELEQSILLMTQQLVEKSESDVTLRDEILDKVESLRGLGFDDDAIVFALVKQYNLTMPTNRAPADPNKQAPNKGPNTEAMAKRLGINEEAEEAILQFVRSKGNDGVGMAGIVERFPEYVGTNQQRFAGYVRGLVDKSKLVVTGQKKGTKYHAR